MNDIATAAAARLVAGIEAMTEVGDLAPHGELQKSTKALAVAIADDIAPDADGTGSPEFVTMPALARRWLVDRSTIYRLIDHGDLPATRIGERGIRFRLADVEAYECSQSINHEKAA